MKKHILIYVFIIVSALHISAQSGKSIRIGYIDMEYILQNVSNYAEANNQLELKAQKWKQELEVKKNEITKLKDALKTEKVLLTKELIEEREEAIMFLETEMGEYQQKRFGPLGDFITQKEVLVKPVQDQIFIAVQDVAERRKYDFIFDKSSDLTMLFAKKNFDISDQVIKIIGRAEKVDQRSKKQIKADEAREYKEDVEDTNPLIAERRKNQTARQEVLEAKKEERRAAQIQFKADAEARRTQMMANREAKKNGTVAKQVEVAKKPAAAATTDVMQTDEVQEAIGKVKAQKEAERKAVADSKQKDFEARKKAIDDRKAKTLADREALKKTRDSIKASVPKK